MTGCQCDNAKLEKQDLFCFFGQNSGCSILDIQEDFCELFGHRAKPTLR